MRRVPWLGLLSFAFICGAHAADSMSFWDTPRRGSNCFNEQPPDAEYFRALRAYDATWVRLTFSKWKSARDGDFLFGSLDDYRALVPEDLATLRRVLDDAHAAGLRVVLVPLELPGSRWVQPGRGLLARSGARTRSTSRHRGLQPHQRARARAARRPRRTRLARDHAGLVPARARHHA
jgi:hypothetical protein